MFWRRGRVQEVSRELESYLEHEVADNMARGMSEAEARRDAHRKLGNSTSIREEVYEMNGLRPIESSWQDFKQGLRQLRRSPGFALAGVAILGLGIAATTAIFSIAYGVLLRDLPYPRPDRLVSISGSLPRMGLPKTLVSAADYFDWRRDQRVFEDLALTRTTGNFNLTGDGEPERLQGARTTASLFPTLHATPLLGRTFTEEEQLDPKRADRVAVLSHGLWKRRFGAGPNIVGRKVSLNGIPHEILGVMRPEFQYPSRDFELWAPLYYPPDQLAARSDNSYVSVARLKDGVSIEQARAQIESLAAKLARDYPNTNADTGAIVGPMLAEMTASVSRAVWVLVAAVGTLFVIGCVNLANLLLARAANRSRELAVRASLGATRSRLARQFFAETIPLAIGGVAVGFVAAHGLLRLLIPLLPPAMPRLEEIALHLPVLLFSSLAAAAATFLVALAPAMQVQANVERGPAARNMLRDGLMIAGIAATVVLLVTSGLLMRSFSNLNQVDPGFQTNRALGIHIAVSRATHGDDAGVVRYLGRLVERLRAVPGVEAVGIVNRLPMKGSQINNVRFEHQPGTPLTIDSRSVNGDYFRSLGVPLLAGRTFDDSDTANRTHVGIIDERVAREAFAGADPLGKRFHIDAPGLPWVQIVGVVKHLHSIGLDQDPRPQIYWPYQQRPQDRMAIVIRGRDAANLTAAARAAIHEVDPDQPLYDILPMTEVVERTVSGQWLNTILIGAFAALALLLAGIGLYGVMAYLTGQRRREFGLRMAVGATASHIVSMVLRQGLVRVAAGLVLGLTISAAVTRFLAAMLHGVPPLDPASFAMAALLLTAVMLAATMIPAWRASRLDPVRALRSE